MTNPVRVYVIENPSAPREQEGTRTYRNGVVRTVRHDGTTNVVTWDYSNDKHAA